MSWSRRSRIQRPHGWAATGVYRELTRRLPRCGGSRRHLEALAERRARGMGEAAAMRKDAAALAAWGGPVGAG